MQEFYDIYDEARHRTREDIIEEMEETSNMLEYSELTDAQRQYYRQRLSDLSKMLDLKDIEMRNREQRILNSYQRWGL